MYLSEQLLASSDLHMVVDWISEKLYTQADYLWVRLAPTGR